MKKQLRVPALILAVMLLLSLSACAKGTGIVYQDKHISVKEVAPNEEITYEMAEWMNITEDDFFGVPVIIATGKVTNLRDIEVSYTKYGEPRTERMALFEFEVSEYLLNTSPVKSKKVLTVGHPCESGRLIQDVPVLAEGKEFLLFLQHPDDLMKYGYEDPMNRASFMDVHVLAPYHLVCEKVDGAYIIAPELRTYFTGVEKVRKTKKMKEILAERGELESYSFAVECATAVKIIKEAAEAYLKGVS